MNETSMANVPYRIAHLGSLHCGAVTYETDLLGGVVDQVNAAGPDLVVVAGDLTAAGYEWEYEQALGQLERFGAPTVVVPGNHDSRNVGYIHFEARVGSRFCRLRQEFPPDRARRLGTTGVTVVGVDSSEPDLDSGKVGREWYGWIGAQYEHPDDLKLFVVHHHLVAIPGAGRELNVITDAGDVLPVLNEAGVDIALTGHRHVPFFWGLNGMLLTNCGTASTRDLPGRVRPSWNELVVDHSTIKVYLHYEDGRRELSAIRSRGTHRLIREAFHLTAAFHVSNHIPVH